MEVLEIKTGARTVKMFCVLVFPTKKVGFFRELVSNHFDGNAGASKRRIERGRESELERMCVLERERENARESERVRLDESGIIN